MIMPTCSAPVNSCTGTESPAVDELSREERAVVNRVQERKDRARSAALSAFRAAVLA